MDWRQFLTGRRAREDLYEAFPPEDRDDWQPALVNEAGPLSALYVAARLLEIVAQRGGTRIGTDDVADLMEILEAAAPDGVDTLCDDEAARILDWLETAEQVPPDEREHESLPPELEIMLGTDLESRVSVAEMALAEGYDLELEYFDESNQTWPRFRCRPLSLEDEPPDEADETAGPFLRVERWDEKLTLPVRNIRWLMPVDRKSERDDEAVRNKLADVLDFPGGEESPEE